MKYGPKEYLVPQNIQQIFLLLQFISTKAPAREEKKLEFGKIKLAHHKIENLDEKRKGEERKGKENTGRREGKGATNFFSELNCLFFTNSWPLVKRYSIKCTSF